MEYLDVESNPDTLYIPAEFYIRPPVRSEYFTGDVLKDRSNDEFLVILTPPCDMVKRTGGIRNAEQFLKKGGYAMIAIKARSIDVTEKPRRIFEKEKEKLSKFFKIKESLLCFFITESTGRSED